MVTALYYPHTSVLNPNLIKTSLLLWDSLECIAPPNAWHERKLPEDKLLREATEIIVRQHIPSWDEMRVADDQIIKFFESDAVGAFARDANNTGRDEYAGEHFDMYHDKLLGRTWHRLQKIGVLGRYREAPRFRVPPAVGLLLMSFLADACAGGTRQKITDRVDAYTWLEEFKARTLGAGYATGLDVGQISPDYDRLVTLSLNVIDGRSIPLRRLVDFRKREMASKSTDYRTMRQRYVNCLERYIERVRKDVKTAQDYDVVLREFRNDIESDLKELKSELKIANLKTLFSKEMAMAVGVVAGALCEPISGLTGLSTILKGVGIAPLVGTHVKLRKARRDAMMSHEISWLYFQKKGRVSLI